MSDKSSEKPSILDTSITAEDYEIFITEALSYIHESKPEEFMSLGALELVRRMQVKDNLSDSPAFLSYIASMRDVIIHLLKHGGHMHEGGILMASAERAEDALKDAAVQLFMTGIRIGRLVENPAQIDELEKKRTEARTRVEAFAKEIEKEEAEESKPANPFNDVGLATDRKVNVHH